MEGEKVSVLGITIINYKIASYNNQILVYKLSYEHANMESMYISESAGMTALYCKDAPLHCTGRAEYYTLNMEYIM